MTTQEATVNLASGLHARPAAKFVQLAQSFKSEITVAYNGKSANPKSILGLLSLGVYKGGRIAVNANGPDEAEAVAALCAYVEQEE